MKKKILSLFVLLMVVTIGARAGDEWSIDFASIGENYDDKTGVTISASVAKVGGTDLGTCTVSSEALDQHFVLQTGTTWLMRKANGLYQGNGGGRAMGMLGCTKGQVITIVGTGDPNPSTNATLKSQNGNTYVYTVTADGDVKFTPARYLYFTSIKVENPSASAVSYTVKYVDEGGTEIKDATTGEGDPGASITISSVEKASFFNEGATKKYIYKSDDSEGKTIAGDGSTVVTLTFREAATYNYSLQSNLGETLASGSGLEGETVYVGYPRYQLSEGKFYTAGVTNKEYRKPIVLSEDNVNATVDYAEWNGSNTVVFYAEGENIEGFATSVANNIPVRASNAKAGTAAEDVTITSLPAGKYKLHVGIFTSKSAFADQVVNFGIGSETFAAAFTGVNLNEITSDEITVTENSDVKFIAEGSWADAQFDYIFIEKTGEYVPVVTSYTVTISNEIENGTVVADPTSAKAGDEVTLTNTPAEGYEFVSYSVTGKTIDEAVIVTDGKFTMPADDVTVSATFQLPAPATYAVTIADGIVGGTVVADPTSAKAGAEVTLTNTPAEGYEFVSYSVTGKIIDEAVIVTDGKFTMPADDVTVSATFKKKAIYIETDLTSQFSALTDYTKWTGATGFTATNFCPAVAINDGTTKQVCEKYEGTCATTGDVFYQTITGLAAGTYKIELYGGAAYTFGRGFSSEAFSEGTWNAGDKIEPSAEVSTGVVLSATTSEGTYGGEIPIYYATNFPDGAATVTLDGVKVGANGELRIGMSKTSQSTNWHVVQLKGVTAQVDAIELHAVTLASAQAALSAEENAVVVGEEKTALEAAIANHSEVTELTSEAYETAINALKAATNAFTSAREAYAALASTKETLVGYAEKYVYASAEKTAAVTAAAEGEPTSAADATSKNANLITALRAMAESHANAEGVEGAEAIAITNPSAEDSTNGWTTVNGEGSDGSIGIRDNEPWTSADGSTAHKYFDGGNWGASAWDVSLTQDVELAAGKYMLSAIGRASGDVALTIFAGESKTTMPSIGAAGGLFDRGWNISSVEFEVNANSTVTIGVQGVTSVIHNWMSFSDFHLVLLEAIPEYAVTIAEGIEGGSVVADPTTAKAGDEVTLINTPAEGYEFVSYSVKGVKSNEAVLVTDGKFTMPADDVTVSAEFKAVDPSGDEEVALAADMFYTWDGYGADASKIASATVDFKVGESVAAGATVAGTGTVDYLTYADMTGSTKVIFEGKDGTPIRLLMNRQESNSGPLVEKTATIAEGKAEISLTDLTYVHVNAIKVNWGAPEGSTINSITFVKPNDPLAGPKEALKDAIAAAKMQNSVAKTEESFAALTKAITDGEAALADAEATVESLTTAKSDIETAVKGLTLAEGYAEVTKEMFKQYVSVDEPGEGTATGGAYELFTASGLPYGDGSVSELKWADLTKYDKLIVTVAGNVAPRLCMNRLVKDGQQAATQEDSKMLDINPNNGNTWSTEKYQTASDGVYTIDLAAIVKDYTFARLHCIKAQGGGSTVVTGMYLHEAPAPVVYAVTIAEGIEGGTVAADPTSAKEGDEVTLINTPAEGYEFVSYSVTGKTTDVAVIVTDGKFTMPADDVTVNATFQKKSVIYIETDLTAKFNSLATTKWTGSSGQVGWAAPKVKTNSGLEVAAWERYNESCDWTGDIMSSSVTGLAPGTYKIELYGAAAFTFGRGFGSTAFTGDFSKDTSDTYKENESIDENTGVTLYAETAEGKVSKEIPIWYATNFNTSGIATATLENVIVGESGEIKIGLSKTSTSTNWHVVQLKGVTAQVPAADVLADAVEAAKSIAESDVPAALYSEIQEAITTYDKEYSTADEYLTAINALNALVDKANGYAPLSAVLNEGAQYKANVPAESPAIAAYDAAIADVKSAYDAAVVADIPAAVKVVEAALPAIAKAQTAPNSDMTRVIVNPTIEGATGWTCEKPKGGNGPLLNGTAFEYWAGNASPRSEGSFDYYQVIEGLPSGKYIISAEMYNSLNGEEGAVFAPTSGVYASSGNDETATLVDVDGTEYIRYATEPVFVKDGTLRLGVKNTEIPMAARWFSADNFTLTLVETIPTYEVDLAEPQNGAIEVSAAVAAEGDKVVITATPNEGYELESVSVKGVTSDIAVQVVTDEVTGEMSFTMPKDAVEVSATFKEIAYPITYAIGMQNGTVEGPVESVAGEKVTLTVTPAEGYELETLTIRAEMSENIINYDVVDYSFTMPKEGVFIIATFVQTTGIDAASAAKGKKIGVKKYFKNGELIIIGKDGKEFRANGAAK